MEPLQNLFPEFDGVDKAAWLRNIAKDLKGRVPEELNWRVAGLEISPFAHAQDVPEKFAAIPGLNPAWQICAPVFIKGDDVEAGNRECLFLLNAGANALQCIFETVPHPERLRVLFSQINLEFISVHFYLPANRQEVNDFLLYLHQLILDKQLDPRLIKGSICSASAMEAPVDLIEKSLTEWASQSLPQFKICVLDENHFPNKEDNVPEALARLLVAANRYIARSVAEGVNPEAASAQIQFSLNIGLTYFIEIARIRALHLLWANLLDAYGLPPAPDSIHAFTDASSKAADPNSQLIRSTTQAMSAVFGGVDSLALNVFKDIENKNDLNQRRLAVNIQHLLQMEAYMDKVADPAAGSYYLETLTRQIAEKAWAHFQQSNAA